MKSFKRGNEINTRFHQQFGDEIAQNKNKKRNKNESFMKAKMRSSYFWLYINIGYIDINIRELFNKLVE